MPRVPVAAGGSTQSLQSWVPGCEQEPLWNVLAASCTLDSLLHEPGPVLPAGLVIACLFPVPVSLWKWSEWLLDLCCLFGNWGHNIHQNFASWLKELASNSEIVMAVQQESSELYIIPSEEDWKLQSCYAWSLSYSNSFIQSLFASVSGDLWIIMFSCTTLDIFWYKI